MMNTLQAALIYEAASLNILCPIYLATLQGPPQDITMGPQSFVPDQDGSGFFSRSGYGLQKPDHKWIVLRVQNMI